MSKEEILLKVRNSPNDKGSIPVQCAMLTQKINELTLHLKNNKKDFQTRRGLIGMVVQRKKLLKYYQKKCSIKYYELLKLLNLSK